MSNQAQIEEMPVKGMFPWPQPMPLALPAPRCPHCGSEDIGAKRSDRAGHSWDHCYECEAQWNQN